MTKRYQVFISSTFADLELERQKVFKTLMEMDCFPAGMESFPANDNEQLEFIKTIIKDCDYYVLIIGGRYGSLTSDGISYTEAEYNYAKELKIPVIAFIHKEPDNLPVNKSDTNPELQKKLTDFKSEVTNNRLVKFWSTPEDLISGVVLSLTSAKKIHPAVGWVKADQLSSPELLSEVHTLRNENDALKEKLRNYEQTTLIDKEELVDFNDSVIIRYSGVHRYLIDSTLKNAEINTTWVDVFTCISSCIYQKHLTLRGVKDILNIYVGARVEDKYKEFIIDVYDTELLKLQFQFLALGLINVDYYDKWSLTDYGKNLTVKLMATKKAAQ